jgi:molecular chaperone DnaJ
MQTSSTCPSCGGEGRTITEKCKTCFGDGIVRGEDTIEIDIPAGVAEGMQMSVSGKGNAGPRGGVPGDLIVVVEEVPHPELVRDGNNVYYDLYISFSDAILGETVEVPTIDGRAKIKILPGTQSGKILRLKDKGLPSVNSYGKGDQLITVNIWTPQELTKDERKIIEKLKDAENFKPDPNKKEKSFFSRMKEYFTA